MVQRSNQKQRLALFPAAGSVVFLLLYFVSAALYPGGSQHSKADAGFSWQHNYWCNLLNADGLNGHPNPGQSFAIAGMVVLAVSLLWFWVISAIYFYSSKFLRSVFVGCGILSVLLLTQLSSLYHDEIISVASFFGLLATGSVFAGLYRKRWRLLFWFGVFNLFLVGVNNYLYYTEGMMVHLPLIQKFTFLSWLLWICFVSTRIYQQPPANDR